MAHPSTCKVLLAFTVVGYGALGAARAITPLSPEFRINTYTAGHQYRSRMSMSPTGEFVVTWTGAAIDGSGFGIVAKRFDSAGTAISAEFVVNTHTLQDQQFSAVSLNEAGHFVVVWRGGNGEDGNGTGVFARRYDTNGSAVGAAFQVNTYTTGHQTVPDVAVGPVGGFFVVWESQGGHDGANSGIFARRHNDSGDPQATEFQVNLVTAGYQSLPRIAITQPSDLVVVWNASGGAVVGRRLGSDGAVGAEFTIRASGSKPALAPAGNGDFMAVWESTDGSFAGVFARRFDLAGDPIGAEFMVNRYTINFQSEPEVAGNGTDFVVTWQSFLQDGSNNGVFVRRLDASGPVGDEFQVNQYTSEVQREPSIGMQSNGAFVVIWDSDQILGYNDVFARRYSVLDLVTLDVDGDGVTEPLTDGLLVLRFLFSFTGTTLTNGAVGALCTRCTADEVVGYLTGLGTVLDIDDDGEVLPLSDGLLVLRYLFGFTGSSLTAGAVDTDDCVRCDAAAIEPYLSSLD